MSLSDAPWPYIISHLKGVRLVDDSNVLALCPAHDDHAPSLDLKQAADGKVLITCRVGCSHDAVMRTAGLKDSDLFPPKPRLGPEVKAYSYRAENKQHLYDVTRHEPKAFRQWRIDAGGNRVAGIDGVRRVIYRLDELHTADLNGQSVLLCEGEKDSDSTWDLGFYTTTVAMGASHWRPEYVEQLIACRARDVVLLPHHDEVGHRHMTTVAQSLLAAGIAVRWLDVPYIGAGEKPKGWDVSDWIAAGGTGDALATLIESLPDYTPPTDHTPTSEYLETLESFLTEVDPPLDYVIPELVPASILALAHGEPRARKSLAAWELALAAATGTAPFGLDRFRPPAAVPVLYVQEEDPRNLTRPRLRAMVQDRCGDRIPPTLHVSVRRGINLDEPTWMDRLIADVRRLGVKLLVLDAARRLSSKADEGPQKVQELTRVLRRIITDTGVSIVLVHHDVKPPREGQDTRRRGHRASGGDWFAASECPLYVEKLTHEMSLIRPEDFKFSTDPDPFTFKTVLDMGRRYILRLEGARVDPKHVDTIGSTGRVAEWFKVNAPTVFEAKSKSAAKACGLGWPTVNSTVDQLVRQGKLGETRGRTKRELRFFWIESSHRGPGTNRPGPSETAETTENREPPREAGIARGGDDSQTPTNTDVEQSQNGSGLLEPSCRPPYKGDGSETTAQKDGSNHHSETPEDRPAEGYDQWGVVSRKPGVHETLPGTAS